MARTYTLKRRAERQEETRQRIVEAAVALHSSIGPAATTVSMIAEQAGVQRHTYYAHFPEERDLLMACSGLAVERDPLPDGAPWSAIEDTRARLKTGLGAVYAWYGRNAELAGCVLRDADHHPLVREVVALRWGAPMMSYHAILGAGLKARPRALLALALSYFTWRSLVRESGLTPMAAVSAMVEAIGAAG